MSDTTGWVYFGCGEYSKETEKCVLFVCRTGDGWVASVYTKDVVKPTKAEAQRLAHALARALEDEK